MDLYARVSQQQDWHTGQDEYGKKEDVEEEWVMVTDILMLYNKQKISSK